MPSNIDSEILQLSHSDAKFKKSDHNLILICDHIEKASNVGGILRLAEGFGVKTVYFIGANTPMSRKTKKAARATMNQVNYKIIDTAEDVINQLKMDGFKTCSLEITNNSRDISNFVSNKSNKIAWFLGNESKGVSPQMLSHSDNIYHIEMYGNNSSFNVVSAASIALYVSVVNLK